MTDDDIKSVREPVDLTQLKEHGISIPVPTPTSINIPNPWKPGENGGGVASAQNGQLMQSVDSESTDTGKRGSSPA